MSLPWPCHPPLQTTASFQLCFPSHLSWYPLHPPRGWEEGGKDSWHWSISLSCPVRNPTRPTLLLQPDPSSRDVTTTRLGRGGQKNKYLPNRRDFSPHMPCSPDGSSDRGSPARIYKSQPLPEIATAACYLAVPSPARVWIPVWREKRALRRKRRRCASPCNLAVGLGVGGRPRRWNIWVLWPFLYYLRSKMNASCKSRIATASLKARQAFYGWKYI